MIGVTIDELQDRLERASQSWSIADLDRVLDRLLGAVPAAETRSQWDDLIGPFYDTSGLAAWLDVTRQAIAGRRDRVTVLALELTPGEFVYPSFQFDGTGGGIPHLAEVHRVLQDGLADAWTIALWLKTPHFEDDPRIAADILRGDRADVARVLAEARATVAARAA